MLGEAYTLEYTELFGEELADAVRYIATELRNPDAASRLIERTEEAIRRRSFAPEAFEPVPSSKEREHPYYRIPVGNYCVLYCVVGKVMDVRRFVYAPSDWRLSV